MENKQTAVEWLFDNLNFEPYDEEEFKSNEKIWEQAKAIEKEQHIELRAESYKQAMFDASKYLVDKLKFKNYGK